MPFTAIYFNRASLNGTLGSRAPITHYFTYNLWYIEAIYSLAHIWAIRFVCPIKVVQNTKWYVSKLVRLVEKTNYCFFVSICNCISMNFAALNYFIFARLFTHHFISGKLSVCIACFIEFYINGDYFVRTNIWILFRLFFFLSIWGRVSTRLFRSFECVNTLCSLILFLFGGKFRSYYVTKIVYIKQNDFDWDYKISERKTVEETGKRKRFGKFVISSITMRSIPKLLSTIYRTICVPFTRSALTKLSTSQSNCQLNIEMYIYNIYFSLY